MVIRKEKGGEKLEAGGMGYHRRLGYDLNFDGRTRKGKYYLQQD